MAKRNINFSGNVDLISKWDKEKQILFFSLTIAKKKL